MATRPGRYRAVAESRKLAGEWSAGPVEEYLDVEPNDEGVGLARFVWECQDGH